MRNVLVTILAALALWSCGGDGEVMRERLAYVSQCNRADTVFTEAWLPTVDSLVQFFDRHGNTNERMMAHYLQGRVHHDMGEAPIALECYQKATEMADTTRNDCDYKTLATTYSQSASLFHQTGLFQYELSAKQCASRYFQQAKDTINSIFCYELTFSPYYRMNKIDSAVNVLLNAREKYLEHGLNERAALAASGLVYIYLKDSLNTLKAKHFMDIYEKESGMFDEFCNLPAHQYQYYGYKGWYFEQKGQTDSAEYYFRKTLQGERALSPFVIAYHGLLNIYQKRKDADSVAKYAELYCTYNDSTFLNRNTEEMARMESLYNYTRHQQDAVRQKAQAAKATFRTWAVTSLLALWIVVSVLAFYFYRSRKKAAFKRIWEDYVRAKGLYEDKEEELAFYQQSVGELIKIKQEAMDRLKEDSSMKAAEYEQLKETAERSKDELSRFLESKNEEIAELRERITLLSSQKDLSRLFAKYDDLLAMPTVMKFHAFGQNMDVEIYNTDWDDLKRGIKSCYSQFVESLEKTCGQDSQTEHAGLLMFLQFRTDEIANILETSKQRVTNIKSRLNRAMFKDSSARSYYSNLSHRYHLK
ncbi:MAG: hypothetical protein IKX24_04025 [Prevotella sp.]|nr:hypothetical protein [Prevotella sp.]